MTFPLPVKQIGWRPGNRFQHRRNRIALIYLCFVFRRDGNGATLVDGKLQHRPGVVSRRPSMSYVLPGTELTTVMGTQRDEFFFCYDPAQQKEFLKLNLPRFCYFRFTREITTILREIKHLLENPYAAGNPDRLDRAALALASEVLLAQEEGTPESNKPFRPEIQEAAAWLETHFNEKPQIEELARRVRLGPRTFFREWKKFSSQTPLQFVLDRRLRHARLLLRETALRNYEIAAECGFNDPMYFCQLFKRRFHCTPGEYRNEV